MENPKSQIQGHLALTVWMVRYEVVNGELS